VSTSATGQQIILRFPIFVFIELVSIFCLLTVLGMNTA
jgi:hypothetical protein